MHYRRLGRSGLKVSEISFGAWVTFGGQLNEDTASDLIHAAYEHGVNYFDNADAYGNGEAEIIMGKAIKDLPREALVISSKVFWPTMPGPNGRGLSRKHVVESINASLRRFDSDYIDLYYCHRYDPDTPIEEVVFTMNTLIQQGKILYWGTSEWTAAQISQAHGVARQYNLIPPTMEQPQYSMLHRDRFETEIAPLAKDLGFGLTTFSPLANGLLTGKYDSGIPADSRANRNKNLKERLESGLSEKVKELKPIADDLGINRAQLAIAWILRHPEVSSVITGATKPEHLESNVAACEVELDQVILDKMDALFPVDD